MANQVNGEDQGSGGDDTREDYGGNGDAACDGGDGGDRGGYEANVLIHKWCFLYYHDSSEKLNCSVIKLTSAITRHLVTR